MYNAQLGLAPKASLISGPVFFLLPRVTYCLSSTQERVWFVPLWYS